MEKNDLDRLNEDMTILMAIHDTSKMFKDYIRKSGERAGIKSSYHRIMGAIEHFGSVSQVDLVNITNLKAPTISLMLKNMELEGLIKKETDPSDARSVKITFTDKGKEQSRKNVEFIRTKEQELEKLISNEERKTILEVLRKLQVEIKEEYENI